MSFLRSIGNALLPGNPFGIQGDNRLVNQNVGGNPYGNTVQEIQASLSNQAPVQTAVDPNPTSYYSGGGGSGGSGSSLSVDDISFLNDQANQLRSLLGRTDTSLSQALTRNNDEYNRNVGDTTQSKDKQVQDQTTQKLNAYNTINQNAGNGYRSLAQIIGRASGTGSSAFQELLPDVVGKDTSSKRQNATSTYGQNISNIETSFASALADLLRQKKDNEENIRSQVESQRQGINNQLAQNAGAVAQAKGGGYAAVKAAQTPYQQAIENSRNAVESFFNDFRTPYTAPELNPNLSQYTTDRSVINAQNGGSVSDPTNPYAALLKKRQEAAI